MSNPISYILLYFISNNTIYIQYPPRVHHGMVCFENKIINNGFDKCGYMQSSMINDNIVAFSYKMNKTENDYKFFKILYYYANNTILDTNWIKKHVDFKSEHDENNLKCYISFIFNGVMFICIFSLLGVLVFLYYRKNCHNYS